MIIDSHEHIMFPVKMQLDKMDMAGGIKRCCFVLRHIRKGPVP